MTNRVGSKKEAQQRGKKSTESGSSSRSKSVQPVVGMESDANPGNKQSGSPSSSSSRASKQSGKK